MAQYIDKTFPLGAKTPALELDLSKSLGQFLLQRPSRKEHDVSFGATQFPKEVLFEQTFPHHDISPDSSEFYGELYPRTSTPFPSHEQKGFTFNIDPEISAFRREGDFPVDIQPESSEFYPDEHAPKISSAIPALRSQGAAPLQFSEVSAIKESQDSPVMQAEASEMIPDFLDDTIQEAPLHSSPVQSVEPDSFGLELSQILPPADEHIKPDEFSMDSLETGFEKRIIPQPLDIPKPTFRLRGLYPTESLKQLISKTLSPVIATQSVPSETSVVETKVFKSSTPLTKEALAIASPPASQVVVTEETPEMIGIAGSQATATVAVEPEYLLDVKRDLRDYEYMHREINRILGSFHVEDSFIVIQSPEDLAETLRFLIEDLKELEEMKKLEAASLPEPLQEDALKSNSEINFDDSLIVERSNVLEMEEEAYAIDRELELLSANIAALYARTAPPVLEDNKKIMEMRAEVEKLLQMNVSLVDKLKCEDTNYYKYLEINFKRYASILRGDDDNWFPGGPDRMLYVMIRNLLDYVLTYYGIKTLPPEAKIQELFDDWFDWVLKHQEDAQEELDDVTWVKACVGTKNDDLFQRNKDYKFRTFQPVQDELNHYMGIYNAERQKSIQRNKSKNWYIKSTAESIASIRELEAMLELASQYYVGFAERWAKQREEHEDVRRQLGLGEPAILYKKYGEMGTSFHSEEMGSPPREVEEIDTQSQQSDISIPSWLFPEKSRQFAGDLSYPSEAMSVSPVSSLSPSYYLMPEMHHTTPPQEYPSTSPEA